MSFLLIVHYETGFLRSHASVHVVINVTTDVIAEKALFVQLESFRTPARTRKSMGLFAGVYSKNKAWLVRFRICNNVLNIHGTHEGSSVQVEAGHAREALQTLIAIEFEVDNINLATVQLAVRNRQGHDAIS